ncbi:e3 ubiquitin-protein ligase [Anaeramoeba ignava]|uniref:E3 ubiquitin-protein ligase n=1 Tax=Anaeramoeba ignava TaxID=1746090 RepID=A0A9Q0LHY1_ANAIG|nr:e3 ubiquitin-protein ligase [Anaeramoeba ignava]
MNSNYPFSKKEHQKEFFHQFSTLFNENNNFSDFTILIQKNLSKFNVHKSILQARSPFFKLFFTSHESNSISFHNFDEQTINNILTYIYTCKINYKKENLLSFWIASVKFGLFKLSQALEVDLINSINFNNVFQILKENHKIHSQNIHKKIIHFLGDNFPSLINKQNIYEISEKEMEEIIQIHIQTQNIGVPFFKVLYFWCEQKTRNSFPILSAALRKSLIQSQFHKISPLIPFESIPKQDIKSISELPLFPSEQINKMKLEIFKEQIQVIQKDNSQKQNQIQNQIQNLETMRKEKALLEKEKMQMKKENLLKTSQWEQFTTKTNLQISQLNQLKDQIEQEKKDQIKNLVQQKNQIQEDMKRQLSSLKEEKEKEIQKIVTKNSNQLKKLKQEKDGILIENQKLIEQKSQIQNEYENLKEENDKSLLEVQEMKKKQDEIKEKEKIKAKNTIQDSKILSKAEYLSKLKEWIHDDYFFQKMKLRFSAKKDGFSSYKFHGKIDDKGKTLILIQTQDDFIFGAFTSVGFTTDQSKWGLQNSDGQENNFLQFNYISDPNAFIFSLKNFKNDPPQKFCVRKGEEIFALGYDLDYGPIFGRCYDLVINKRLNGGISRFGYSFELPLGIEIESNDALNYLVGEKKNWKIIEMEVYFF